MQWEPEPYEYQDGDHWVDESIHQITQHAERGGCSPELHALLGVLRGVRNGHVTEGSQTYRTLAGRATVAAGQAHLNYLLVQLGASGLFSDCRLEQPPGKSAPLPSGPESGHKPQNWGGSLCESLNDIQDYEKFPAIPMLHGIAIAIQRGLVTRGDPEYGMSLLDCAKKSGSPEDYSFNLEKFGEVGLFGRETLLGCQPDRSSAVSRIK